MLEKKQIFREVFFNDIHVATHVKPKNSHTGLNFVTDDEKFLQLGIWNYKKGHELPAHYHNEFERKSFKTNEFVYVVSGKLKCDLFTEEGVFIDTLIAKENEGIIQHNFTHLYTILEDSIILESKNGPFLGVEKDKTVIDVDKK